MKLEKHIQKNIYVNLTVIFNTRMKILCNHLKSEPMDFSFIEIFIAPSISYFLLVDSNWKTCSLYT